jgi:hypothetical protein
MQWRFRAAPVPSLTSVAADEMAKLPAARVKRNVMANLPYEIHRNPTFQAVQIMLDTVAAVARGEKMLTLIGGGTGIGKTHHARQICRKDGIKDVPEERPTSADALVSFFWLYRDCPVGLLDECDHLLRQETTCNIIKVASGDPRVVMHAAKQSVLNEQYLAEGSRRYRGYIPPTRFLLGNNMRPIMLSNKNYQDPSVIAELPIAHWNALVGRGLDPIWIPTDGNDGRDLFEYTYWIATEGKMLRNLQFTWEVSRAAIQFYIEHVHKLVDIHPRRLVMIAQTIRDNPDSDKHMARLNQMLRNSYQRPKLIIPTTWVAMDGGLLLPKHPPRPKRARGTLKPVVAAQKPQPKVADSGGATNKPEPKLFGQASQPVPSATGSELSEPTPAPTPASSTTSQRIDPQSPVESDDGYETLDENGCVEHFGIPYTDPPHLVPQALAVQFVLEERVGTRAISAWIKAGYAKSRNNQTLFNVAAIREAVDDAKAQIAKAEAAGFRIAEPAAYGAANHAEAHKLMLKALGLRHVVDGLKPLVDGGYLRIIAGMRLFQVEKMRALMELGRAAQRPPNPVDPP